MRKLLIPISYILLLSAHADPPAYYLPAHDSGDNLVNHTGYVLKYNKQAEQPDWVAYKLTKAEVETYRERTNDFRPDPDIETESASL